MSLDDRGELDDWGIKGRRGGHFDVNPIGRAVWKSVKPEAIVYHV